MAFEKRYVTWGECIGRQRKWFKDGPLRAIAMQGKGSWGRSPNRSFWRSRRETRRAWEFHRFPVGRTRRRNCRLLQLQWRGEPDERTRVSTGFDS